MGFRSAGQRRFGLVLGSGSALRLRTRINIIQIDSSGIDRDGSGLTPRQPTEADVAPPPFPWLRRRIRQSRSLPLCPRTAPSSSLVFGLLSSEFFLLTSNFGLLCPLSSVPHHFPGKIILDHGHQIVTVKKTNNKTHFLVFNSTFYSITIQPACGLVFPLTRDYFQLWNKTVIHNNSEWAKQPAFLRKHKRIQYKIYNKCTRLLFYESINVFYRQYDKTQISRIHNLRTRHPL